MKKMKKKKKSYSNLYKYEFSNEQRRNFYK